MKSSRKLIQYLIFCVPIFFVGCSSNEVEPQIDEEINFTSFEYYNSYRINFKAYVNGHPTSIYILDRKYDPSHWKREKNYQLEFNSEDRLTSITMRPVSRFGRNILETTELIWKEDKIIGAITTGNEHHCSFEFEYDGFGRLSKFNNHLKVIELEYDQFNNVISMDVSGTHIHDYSVEFGEYDGRFNPFYHSLNLPPAVLFMLFHRIEYQNNHLTASLVNVNNFLFDANIYDSVGRPTAIGDFLTLEFE